MYTWFMLKHIIQHRELNLFRQSSSNKICLIDFVVEVPYRNYELGIELFPKPSIIIFFFITKFRLREVHFTFFFTLGKVQFTYKLPIGEFQTKTKVRF